MKLGSPTLSLRRLLLLITGALTAMIAALCVVSVFSNATRLSRIYALKDAVSISDQVFTATEKVSIERDLALSILTARDRATVEELRPLLVQGRREADEAADALLTATARYQYAELGTLRANLRARLADIARLRVLLDQVIAERPRHRDPTLNARWSDAANRLLAETESLWVAFTRHFTDIDATATQRLRYRQFVRTITDYSGRERSIIAQLLSENRDPTIEETAQLLRAEGVLDLSWRMSRQVAEQSGLYTSIAPYFTDAESHFAVMRDMSRETFFVPGARHGGSYLIGPDLWFELSSQASDSLSALRAAEHEATSAYLDELTHQTEAAIALQIGILLFAMLLCGYSFWVVITRVIRPVNDIIDALVRATLGESVEVPAGRHADEIGQLTDVLAVFQTNVDEIKRTAAQLDSSQQRLRAIVEHATDGLITIDAWGAILSFNPACERIFGYAPAEIIGRHIRVLTPALYGSGHDEDLSAYVAGADAKRTGATAHEVMGKRIDGSTFPLDLTISTFKLDDGEYYLAIVRDISRRKRHEQALVSYTHALERSNKELDDFAYIASHDLKEPLRGIHNHSRFLIEDNDGKLDEESNKRLQRLIYLSQRMERLVNDLLYFSRLGRQEMAVQHTDIATLVQDVEDRLAHFLEENNAKLIVATPLPSMMCDRVRVGELFNNLITNAVKYNDAPEKRVEIGFAPTARGPSGGGERNVLYVKDNGHGIDPEFHQEVFRIFKRLHAGATEGTGVGLTFVKKIVERHGGRIWIESEVGRGSTFYFTLEAASDDAKAERAA